MTGPEEKLGFTISPDANIASIARMEG
jgi:hypothetical protein